MRFAALCSLVSFSALSAAAATCTTDALVKLGVPRMSVENAAVVAAAAPRPEFCRVTGTVITTGEGAPDGAARFDVRLPVSWNGKFLFYGVGGLAGSIPQQPDSENALARGYATAITDAGHQAAGTDARWAVTAPGTPDKAKIADYYFRAAHDVTVAAKELVLKYYAAPKIDKAYFAGCSNGGRMALMEAERFPDDFDGVISGAPFMTVRALLITIKVAQGFTPDSFLPPEQLEAIDKAVYDSCDAADGAKDGLILNPARCSFRPEDLVCSGGRSGGCLTPGQAATLRRYFEPVRDHRGNLVTFGFSLTDLAGRGGAGAWTFGLTAPDLANPELWASGAPAGWQFADHITQDLVEYDPAYKALSFDLTKEGVIGDAALKLFDERTHDAGVYDSQKLLPFVRKDKKLLLYHGWSDPALTPYRTMNFYEDLAARVKGGIAGTQKNVRLFMMPGVQHCGGGPGPDRTDMLTALDAWVSGGTAPDTIVATKSANGAVTRTMPLCKYPEVARYKGSGDINQAANWSCSGGAELRASGPAGTAAGFPPRKGK